MSTYLAAPAACGPRLTTGRRPRRLYRRRRRWPAVLSTLGTLGIAFLSGLWLFSGEPTAADRASLDPFSHTLAIQPNGDFSLGGIAIGMPARSVKLLHPGIAVRRHSAEVITGTFVAAGATHTVWFVPGRGANPVYRIRFQERTALLSSDVIQARFAQQFGQALVVECRQGQLVSRQGVCTFKWLTRDGVSFEVRSQAVTDGAGRPQTLLTITATDSATANKLTALRIPPHA